MVDWVQNLQESAARLPVALLKRQLLSMIKLVCLWIANSLFPDILKTLGTTHSMKAEWNSVSIILST